MRDWLITAATMIVFIAFWAIWPVATWIIGTIILSGLIGYLYGIGTAIEKRKARALATTEAPDAE